MIWLALFGMGVGLAAFVLLLDRPIATLAAAQGLYPAEPGRDGQMFQWTSSRVEIPLHAPAAALRLTLRMAAEDWPGRPPALLTLRDAAGAAGYIVVAPEARRYHLLLPGDATALRFQVSLARPPQPALRWVGVQVYEMDAAPLGPPLRAAASALLVGLGSVPLLIVARRVFARGYGPLALIMLLGLGLRTLRLGTLPPGANQDEMVSVVDAWYLLQTARDHHEALLPLGAFEAFGDWISPLLTYLNLPAVAIFGPGGPLAGRVTTALLGTLAIPLCYGLARSLDLPRVAALGCALLSAISPWQVAMSRFAAPPSLVFLTVTLCLWAAVLFVRRGGPREAWLLALAAGIGLHAYPALKLYVPLLLGAALTLALWAHGRQAARRWLWPGLALFVLWLPFIYITFLVPASSTRFNSITISAASPAAWLAAWWRNYSVYLRPDFYYLSGDGTDQRGYLQNGVQVWLEAPLLLLGVGYLLWRALARPGAQASRGVWWLLLVAVLLAPLPTSLTMGNPHVYRATTIGPLYVLLVGLGIAALWGWLAPERAAHGRRRLAGGIAALYAGGLLWLSGLWFAAYVQNYPAVAAAPWRFQDGLLETMRALAEQADAFDEVWIARESGKTPYIYLLAALPTPQRALVFERGEQDYIEAIGVGKYRMQRLLGVPIPADAPALELILNQQGDPTYIVQEWQHDGKRLLVMRAIADLGR